MSFPQSLKATSIDHTCSPCSCESTSFFASENELLRGDNVRLLELLELQQAKQVIIEEYQNVNRLLDHSQQLFHQKQQPIIQQSSSTSPPSDSSMGATLSTVLPFKNSLSTMNSCCNCSILLTRLFHLAMVENKRLVTFISTLKRSRDEATAKNLIDNKIIRGLEAEQISLVDSINAQITEQQTRLSEQARLINEFSTLNPIVKFTHDAPTSLLVPVAALKQQQITAAVAKTTDESLNQDELQLQNMLHRTAVIELNAQLSRTYEQINDKDMQITTLTEKNNELIVFNSLLTTELKQMKTSLGYSHQPNNQLHHGFETSFTKEIADQLNVFADFSYSLSDDSKMVLSLDYLATPYGDSKPHETYEINLKSHSHKWIDQSIPLAERSTTTALAAVTAGMKCSNKSISNFQPIKRHRSHKHLGQTHQNHQGMKSSSALNKQSEQKRRHTCAFPQIPKLDLSRAMFIQQANVKNQQDQENQLHNIALQNRIVQRQKALETKLMLGSKKGESDKEPQYLIQQEIKQLQAQHNRDQLSHLSEENSRLLDKLNHSQINLEQAYLKIAAQDHLIDGLKRDIAHAHSINQTLIQSNNHYASIKQQESKAKQEEFQDHNSIYLINPQSYQISNNPGTGMFNFAQNCPTLSDDQEEEDDDDDETDMEVNNHAQQEDRDQCGPIFGELKRGKKSKQLEQFTEYLLNLNAVPMEQQRRFTRSLRSSIHFVDQFECFIQHQQRAQSELNSDAAAACSLDNNEYTPIKGKQIVQANEKQAQQLRMFNIQTMSTHNLTKQILV